MKEYSVPIFGGEPVCWLPGWDYIKIFLILGKFFYLYKWILESCQNHLKTHNFITIETIEVKKYRTKNNSIEF